jgi:hypothetical protein
VEDGVARCSLSPRPAHQSNLAAVADIADRRYRVIRNHAGHRRQVPM